MVNPTIENIGRIVESGNTEKFMGESSAAGEIRATREMRKEGMEPYAGNESAGAVGKNFSDMLKDSVSKVNEMQVDADTAVKEMIAGRNKNIHETMLTIERADTSLKLMMQVRNKIIDAYREIMRMQV